MHFWNICQERKMFIFLAKNTARVAQIHLYKTCNDCDIILYLIHFVFLTLSSMTWNNKRSKMKIVNLYRSIEYNQECRATLYYFCVCSEQMTRIRRVRKEYVGDKTEENIEEQRESDLRAHCGPTTRRSYKSTRKLLLLHPFPSHGPAFPLFVSFLSTRRLILNSLRLTWYYHPPLATFPTISSFLYRLSRFLLKTWTSTLTSLRFWKNIFLIRYTYI